MKPVTETIKTLIASHGDKIIQQPQRLKAMLADLLPNEKRMRYLLDLSLQAEIPKKLMAIQNETSSVWDTNVSSIKHYFKEEYFLEDKPIKLIFDSWVEVIPRKDNSKADFVKNKAEIIIEKKGNEIDYEDDVTDIDGNVYKTVRIGNQVWMAENLKVSSYRNGDLIPNVTEDRKWWLLSLDAWCNYENDPTNDLKYGKLYNWFAIDDKRGLAPKGWHVASDEEWTRLTNYLGGEKIAGDKLKEKGSATWSSLNQNATNENGFSGLPGGYRNNGNGLFGGFYCGYWWTATAYGSSKAWSRIMQHNYSNVIRSDNYTEIGFSVRCVRDLD